MAQGPCTESQTLEKGHWFGYLHTFIKLQASSNYDFFASNIIFYLGAEFTIKVFNFKQGKDLVFTVYSTLNPVFMLYYIEMPMLFGTRVEGVHSFFRDSR